ncbi:hypothetical protein BC792_11341 [Sphingobacterium allocomposti]|uniref:Uncharacterized protein n=1 Tax=Sphingobacterium allocomposti TaxID=415956 RepID=A0A5S5DDQ8_9SPHI|nr:hypothetical protein BC792_11341 [Sphingobacterium composti Yoo et al. 2007 non Ten et al. 2007]
MDTWSAIEREAALRRIMLCAFGFICIFKAKPFLLCETGGKRPLSQRLPAEQFCYPIIKYDKLSRTSFPRSDQG